MLAICLRGVATQLGASVSDEQAEAFGASVADWPPFPDSGEALARLRRRFRLVTITNCDDDLIAASERRMGVSFDIVVTAQQVGRYKPDTAGFHLAHARIERELGVPKERILHVAQSLFHDHVPAKSLGMQTVWIDRRNGREGGATPAAEAVEPDARFTTMEAFAADAVPDAGTRPRDRSRAPRRRAAAPRATRGRAPRPPSGRDGRPRSHTAPRSPPRDCARAGRAAGR